MKAARLLVFMRALALRRPAMAFRPKASVTPACAAKVCICAQRVALRQKGTGLAVLFCSAGMAQG